MDKAQRDLDQAPLLRLPLRPPARFYTGEVVRVPRSQQPDDEDESCWSSHRPTHHIAHRRGLVLRGIGFVLVGNRHGAIRP